MLVPTGKNSRNGEQIRKPKSVLDYNKAKKGVDLSDQMAAYYTPIRKQKNWYRKIALELLTATSVINAWIIFNKYISHKTWSFLNFKESLVLSLITSSPTETVRPGKRCRSIGNSPNKQKQKRNTRKRCISCYEVISVNEGSKVASRKAEKISIYCDKCDMLCQKT